MNIFEHIDDLERKFRRKGYRTISPCSEPYIAGALTVLSELRDKLTDCKDDKKEEALRLLNYLLGRCEGMDGVGMWGILVKERDTIELGESPITFIKNGR